MASNSEDFIKIAKILSEDSSEINQRCAASRAYYALYHLCNSFADRIELDEISAPDISVGVHERLIRQLINFNQVGKEARNIKAIGNLLKNGRDIRAQADYKIAHEFKSKDADIAIGIYSKILERIEESKL